MNDKAEYTHDVFISYSQADRDWVWDELLPQLEQAGLKVIIGERNFKVGAPSLVNMEWAVDSSRHTLLVLTPAWLKSEWAEFESLLAGTADPGGRRRKLIPLMLEPCQLPRRIAMLTYADFTHPSQRDAQMARLLKSIGPSGDSSPLQTPWEKLPDSVSKRRIDAAAPSHAQVGQQIDILVQIRFPDSPLLGIEDWLTKQTPTSIEQVSESVALEFPINPHTGKLDPARLEICVVAPDFEIEGAMRQLVEVPPDQYSKKVSFLLTPTKPGICRINVEVYSVDKIYLGTIPVETNVVEITTSATTNVANLYLFVVVVEQKSSHTSVKSLLEPTKKIILHILRDPMWQGIAALVGILACIAAGMVVPEVRRFVGLEEPTPPPTLTATAYSIAVSTPAETPTPTLTAPPVPSATNTSAATDVPTPTNTQVSTPSSISTPVTPSPAGTDAAYLVVIFADKDSLAVYVPGQMAPSLAELTLQYSTSPATRQNFRFADMAAFAPYMDGTFHEPFCLCLERADSAVPLPTMCNFANRPTLQVADGDVFWWDAAAAGTKTLSVNLGAQRLAVCGAGFERCEVDVP